MFRLKEINWVTNFVLAAFHVGASEPRTSNACQSMTGTVSCFRAMQFEGEIVMSTPRADLEKPVGREPTDSPQDPGSANRIESESLQPGSASRAAGEEGRHERIARAAYQRAEQRGFQPGQALDDWLDAEREIDG